MTKSLKFFRFPAAALAASVSLCAAAAQIAEPFSYPQSLLAGHPAASDPVVSGAVFGSERVTLEETPIREIAKKAGVQLIREGSGEYTRDWTCMQNGEYAVWLIASDSPQVTEVQMSRYSAFKARSKTGVCRALPQKLAPATIGGLAPGMTAEDAVAKFGKPTYADEEGWMFWCTSQTLQSFSNTRIRMNWTGAQVKDGQVIRIFTSQVTNP